MSIRQLAPGEKLPQGEPVRYVAGHGYIRLRWKIGPQRYVETYEHRVDGNHVTTAEHVHHSNHVRHDNRPSNLVPLTAASHLAHHGKKNRRFDHDAACAMYRFGVSTPKVAAAFGVNAATVYRMLVRRGIKPRTLSEACSTRMTDIEDAVLAMRADGMRGAAIAQALGISRAPVDRILRTYGLTFPPGRPQYAPKEAS